MSERKEFLQKFLDEIWSQGLLGKVDHYIAPRYSVYHDPGDPFDGQVLDIEGYKKRLVQIRQPFPDQAFTTGNMVEEGDKLVVSWHWKGTHLGAIPGFAATGKQISMTGITLYSFAGGKLSGHWQLVDRLGVFQQLSQP